MSKSRKKFEEWLVDGYDVSSKNKDEKRSKRKSRILEKTYWLQFSEVPVEDKNKNK